MRPYFQVFKNTIQKALIYRARIFAYALVSTITPMLMIIIWTEYYNQGKTVKGFEYKELIIYYIVVTLISLVLSRVQTNVTEDIKEGELSNYVIKPFRYYYFRLFWEIAWHTIKTILFAIPFLVILVFLLELPLVDILPSSNYHLAILSILLAYLLSFNISMIFGTSAFYITQTTGVINMSFILSEIVTGKIFPLSFYPESVQQVLNYLPYRYFISFPVEVITNGISGSDIYNGLIWQGIWIVISFLIFQLIWRKGIYKFSGIGL